MTVRQVLVLLAYLFLLLISIPWYWPAGDLRHVFGIPLWVVTVISVGLMVSILTSWNLLTDDDQNQSEGDE